MNRYSKKAIVARSKRINAIMLISIILAALLAFNSSWKGYDEKRVESYEYYEFTYENGILTSIGVNNLVFNIPCDKTRPTKYSCVLTGKEKMRKFKAMVNR